MLLDALCMGVRRDLCAKTHTMTLLVHDTNAFIILSDLSISHCYSLRIKYSVE